MTSTAIPVSLLTGFLGSGKTTLLNHLLADARTGRVAVVMNEFGEIGLDHDLVESATEAMALLQSGCLCCTVRGDLAQTLSDLKARRDRGDIAFERVVIETTGIADPGPILQSLVMDPALADDFKLDGVLTTVDCATGPATLDAQFEAVQQIAMADRLILTKADLALPADIATLDGRLAAINPGAPRLRADHGAVDPLALFGVAPGADSPRSEALHWVAANPAKPDPAPGGPSAVRPFGLAQDRGLFERPATATGLHDGRISSQSAQIDHPISPIVFDLWLDSLMRRVSGRILRLKAVVHVEGIEHPFALHGVQHVFHPPTPLPQWPRDDKVSRIVVIGRDLPAGYLEESLALLHSRPDTTAHGH
ncbi:MAG: putative GTPases (G3E family) [Rhodobacteraceae bacterium HLUCCA12]|nr:MAG: putative GTPases (G3E family) [Rhodobacteraceae bacterium HLUCCA12]